MQLSQIYNSTSMAVTRQNIIDMLSDAGYKFKAEKDEREIFLRIDGMKTYRHRSGNDIAFIVIILYPKGNHIEIFTPACFAVPKEPQREALFFKACAILNWKSNLCKLKYDHLNGELEAIVDFPIADSIITQNQLVECIEALIYFLNISFPVLEKINQEGLMDMDLIDDRKWVGKLLGSIDQEKSKRMMDEMKE